MDENRRQFIATIGAIFGTAALDGFGLLKASSLQSAEESSIKFAQALSKTEAESEKGNISRNLEDYPHITDIFAPKDLESFFPIIVNTCLDKDYLAKMPFFIELEVCKIWKESSFQLYALSNSAAGGLEQFMVLTAKEMGLRIIDSPEIQKLDSSVKGYFDLQREIGEKRQEIHNLVESGNVQLTQNEIDEINRLRAELGELNNKRPAAYLDLLNSKTEYINKIRGMSAEQLMEFDARFVQELAIPAGMSYLTKSILECRKSFGGSLEINVWRGLAAYNAGLERTKRSDGLPYIQETVNYTRVIVSKLTKSLELKYAYSTRDDALIAQTKSRLGISNPE